MLLSEHELRPLQLILMVETGSMVEPEENCIWVQAEVPSHEMLVDEE